jgi:hypothetical protein
MSTQLWLTVLGILLTIAINALVIYGGFRYFAGRTNARLDNLEKKMDKHNCLMERVAALEATNAARRNAVLEQRPQPGA